ALDVEIALERWSEALCWAVVTVFSPAGEPVGEAIGMADGSRIAARIPIPAPQLWWPAGYGEQPLYRVQIKVQAETKGATSTLASTSYAVGLRTIELRREPDAWGESFAFVINAAPIFARGANWIPADVFPARVTPERLEQLIRSAATANMNMLRVWGGGYYESDAFYDLCDRYGILVWQDFMFACAAYPLDEPAFVENVRAEVVQAVRRLRHHACLALWCGNNEIELMWGTLRLLEPKARLGRLREHHARFFHVLLPEWVRAEDPDRPYWPGSPSSGGAVPPAPGSHNTCDTSRRLVLQPVTQASGLQHRWAADVNSDARGDTHIWHVWHGLKPAAYYRRRFTRFCSEFGLESLPALETVAAFGRPEEHDLHSRALTHRQRSAGGNDKLLYYLADRFRLPRDFADLIYLTQLVQAEGVRIAVEHWRRNRPRCMGALYWQFNDCWPAISWSSLDYFGRWKALHYAARRFNAPTALSIAEEADRAEIWISNETRAVWNGTVHWSVETLVGEAVEVGKEEISVPALSAAACRRFDFGPLLRKHGRTKLALVAELRQGEECIGRRVALFAPERQVALPDPQLVAEVAAASQGKELAITVRSRALARFVELSLPAADVIFSDNYFDLPAGRAARVTCPLPAGWTIERVRRELCLRSLADVQPAGPAWRDRIVQHRAGLRPRNVLGQLVFALLR
ncbi:MAG: beta-mannosidase, partial [Anaerolineae bacterium]